MNWVFYMGSMGESGVARSVMLGTAAAVLRAHASGRRAAGWQRGAAKGWEPVTFAIASGPYSKHGPITQLPCSVVGEYFREQKRNCSGDLYSSILANQDC